jgi:hypothetical protein
VRTTAYYCIPVTNVTSYSCLSEIFAQMTPENPELGERHASAVASPGEAELWGAPASQNAWVFVSVAKQSQIEFHLTKLGLRTISLCYYGMGANLSESPETASAL